MRNVTYRQNGWTIQVKADRAPNNAKNLAHGNNTLLGCVLSTLTLAPGQGVYNGQGCGACIHFPTCPKGVTATTDSCQWRPTRFQSARQIQ